jgi:hypothetical protein
VLDGVAEPADLADGLWPPASPVGRVLVTSSRRDFDEAADPHVVQVRPFGREEAVAYLRDALGRHLPPPGPAPLTALATRLGGVPASLGRAVRHIVAEGIDVATYIQRLDDRSNGGPSVHAPLRLTIDEANRRRPAGVAAPLLQLASALAEPGAPREVLSSAPALALLTRLRGGDAAAVTADDVNRAVRVLYDLSLVDVQEHPSATTVPVEASVRDEVLAAAPDDLLPELVRTAADALAAVWPEAEGSMQFAECLRAGALALLTVRRGRHVLMHDGIHPVLLRAARSTGEWGKVTEAAGYFDLLATAGDELLGAGHPDVLSARSCAARWRGESGNAVGPIAELEAVLELQQRFGSNRPDSLLTRQFLVRLRRVITDNGSDAMAALDELLADRTRVLGPDHLDTLDTRAEVVMAHMHHPNRVVEAAALLADVERVAGPDHRQTLEARQLLVAANGYAHDSAAAVAAADDLVADTSRALGPDHPVTLASRLWAATVPLIDGDWETAQAELAGLLADHRRLLGSDHPDTLETRSLLAQCLQISPDPAGALVEHLALLADRRRVLGHDHPRTLDTLESIAGCHAASDEAVRAVMALAELASCRSRVLGPDHRATLFARSALGRWRGEAGDAVGAVADLAAVAADLARVLGPDDDTTLVARHNLAWYCGEAGDPSGAVDAFAQLLADHERISGPDDPEVGKVREVLAEWQRKAAKAAASTGQPASG